ncbi:MAG: hypothetical protein ACO1N3_00085 [Gammaproteobacteria bacterium]
MKYIIVAAGLLFSLNTFAMDSSSKSSEDNTAQRFSRPMCKSFCDQYHVGVQSCNVQITGSSHSMTAPGNGRPASASGNSLGLTYDIVCETAPAETSN